MKPSLRRIQGAERCWHFADGQKVYGPPRDLRGNVSGLRGDVSDLRGNADACELTDADREEGVSVHTLVAESAPERGSRVNTTARRHPRTLAEAWPQHYAWRGVVTRIRRPLIERWSCALGWLSLFGLLAGIGALLAWRG